MPVSDSSRARTTVVACPMGASRPPLTSPALWESLEPTAAILWPRPSRRSYSVIASVVNGLGLPPKFQGPVAISKASTCE